MDEESKRGGRLGPSLIGVEAWMPEVEAVMRDVLETYGGPHLGPMACEHLGTGGKRLRARLPLAATRALGGEPKEAVPWAAACELFHNATLVHDDVQDGDRTRRGQPTVWARHGIPQAINCGDLMLIAPFAAITRGPAASCAALCATLARHGAQIVAGQAMELVVGVEQQTSRASYVATATGKTAGLFEMPIEGAALMCGLSPERATALATAFRPLGLLFQLQDDLLDLWGNKGREAPGGDLREGKISALVVAHLELHPGDRVWLLELLARPREATTAAEVEAAIERIAEQGSRARVGEWVEELARQVRTAPALVGAPALARVADELVVAVLAPIAHLGLGRE